MAKWPVYSGGYFPLGRSEPVVHRPSNHASGTAIDLGYRAPDTMHFEINPNAEAFAKEVDRFMGIATSGLITAPDYTSFKTSAGPWCNDHRSLYCEHALDYITQRTDVVYLQSAITGEPPDVTQWASERQVNDSGEICIVVPVYPEYCVWNQIYYEVKMLDGIGPVAELWSQDPGTVRKFSGVRRIMPGESAADLGATLRQEFEDDLDFEAAKLLERAPRSWPPARMKCRGSAHSMKYNTTAARICTPDSIRGAVEQNRDRILVYSMLYCYMRHKRCLFCYVNENFRDAVRVNPELAGFLGQSDENEPTDFDDLVPF